MKSSARIVLLATVTTAAVAGGAAFAQYTPANTGYWGTEIPAKEIDPAIRAAAEALGLVRDTRLVVGQVNTLEYVGHGTVIDPEGGPSARPIEVPKFSYTTALQIPASRLDYETAAGRTVRVVKKDRAWNEEKPGVNPSPSNAAAYRAQAIWLMPHAAVHAAAFAAAKKCLDGKACDAPVEVRKEDGKTVFVTSVNGQSYKTTLGADNRPEKVEATIATPGGGTKKAVATYSDYRNGQKSLVSRHSINSIPAPTGRAGSFMRSTAPRCSTSPSPKAGRTLTPSFPSRSFWQRRRKPNDVNQEE